MAYNAYYGSKPVSDWQANGPAEGGHDFIDQINQQQSNINEQKGRYDTQYGNMNNAQQAYNDAYKNQQNYSDLYKSAKGEEGVDAANQQYQKSLASVNATAAAMNNLPSSINAGSNVVLTGAQRNAALGNQMAKYQNTMDYWTRQNAGDLSQYQTALGAAQNLAGNNMAQQQTKVNQAMTNAQSQMDMANQLYNQLLNERNVMRQIYGDMYDDEYRHMQQEIEAWANNLQAETQRYAQDQETARNNAKLAADRYAADSGLRLQQYMQQQQADRTPSFLDYVNSDAYLNSMGNDMGYDEKKMWAQRLANNYADAVNSGNARDLQNIISGSSYQGYKNWLNG